MKMPGLSIIIPTLNEQAHIHSLLNDLNQQTGLQLQIIVADGGSRDRTRQLASTAEWVTSPAGRAVQMNTGRRYAEHPYLLFLHADSRLPQTSMLLDGLRKLISAGKRSAGHFGLSFADAPAQAARFYQHLEAKSLCNRPETINGDQGLMISCSFFDELGGFDETWPFLEDQAISQTIFEQGQWIVLPGRLQTSARRFESEGRRARYFLMMLIMCARRAQMDSFLREAPNLYPQQSDTAALRVAPFLELILAHARETPRFWPSMADYLIDNAWQLAFILDRLIQRSVLLPLHDRLNPLLPRRILIPVLAPLLKRIFEGPVLANLQKQEANMA